MICHHGGGDTWPEEVPGPGLASAAHTPPLWPPWSLALAGTPLHFWVLPQADGEGASTLMLGGPDWGQLLPR